MIEGESPHTWQDLQEKAARILRECGMAADTDRPTSTVRGVVNVDVVAVDPDSSPPATVLIECKHWHRRVPKTVIHSFRTVTADAGANLGLIISSAGFQSGSPEAAAHTNLRLVDWGGFEDIFVQRWFERYMIPALHEKEDPLFSYTEPFNSRIFRKADALDETRQARFRDLRRKYSPLVFALPPWDMELRLGPEKPTIPTLPLRSSLVFKEPQESAPLPGEVLDAHALRPLMDAIQSHIEKALAEFDEVFGERA